MAKDGTNRGGRRVRAGAKPDQLKDKLEAGKPAFRLFEPADLDPFGLEGGDVGDGELLEGETMPQSTPTAQSPSRSTTARAFDRCGEWLHKLLAIISIRQLRRPDQELRNPDFFHTRRRVGSEFSLSHISEACLGTP